MFIGSSSTTKMEASYGNFAVLGSDYDKAKYGLPWLICLGYSYFRVISRETFSFDPSIINVTESYDYFNSSSSKDSELGYERF